MKRTWTAVAIFVALAACSGDSMAPAPDNIALQGVTLRAQLEAAGPNTNLLLSVFNESDRAVTADFAGPCMLRARLYRPGTRHLVWDGLRAFPLCPDDVFHLTIQPRGSIRGQWVIGMSSAMLGDSLETGEYSVVAAVRPQGKGGEVIEIFAGNARF